MAKALIACPICGNTLDLVPVEVGPTCIRYEIRCTVIHSPAMLKRALQSLGSVVKP